MQPIEDIAECAYLSNWCGFQDRFLINHLWDIDKLHAFQIVLVLPFPVQGVIH